MEGLDRSATRRLAAVFGGPALLIEVRFLAFGMRYDKVSPNGVENRLSVPRTRFRPSGVSRYLDSSSLDRTIDIATVIPDATLADIRLNFLKTCTIKRLRDSPVLTPVARAGSESLWFSDYYQVL